MELVSHLEPTIPRMSPKQEHPNRVHVPLVVPMAVVAASQAYVAATHASATVARQVLNRVLPTVARQGRMLQNKALARSAHPKRLPKGQKR